MDYNHYFTYNPLSGSLQWKIRDRGEFDGDYRYAEHLRHCGKDIGNKMTAPCGRPCGITINTRKKGFPDTLAHRIIWQMHNGPIPQGMMVDHIDGNPFNNRLENLRLATAHDNMRNSRRHSINNHGVKGVSWDKHNRKWQTEIRTSQGRIFLGRFSTKGLAAIAYAKAAIRYHGEFAKIGG